MDKEIKDYIDKRVEEEVKKQLEHKEDIRREIQSQTVKFKGEIRKLILGNSDDPKKAYGEFYKQYSEETGDNLYSSAKEKGLSIIDYISQFGDIKLLYSLVLCKYGEKKFPTEEELEKTLPEETVF